MCKYFISESSGRMETGKDLIWQFPEFADKFPITKIKTEVNRSISWVWDPEMVVNIVLEEQSDKSTLVKVNESSKELNEKS